MGGSEVKKPDRKITTQGGKKRAEDRGNPRPLLVDCARCELASEIVAQAELHTPWSILHGAIRTQVSARQSLT